MTRMTCWRSMWRSSCWLDTKQAEPSTNRLQPKILLPMGEYWVLYNKWTLSHNYGHRNSGHGRFRPEVLRHRYLYMMGVMECVPPPIYCILVQTVPLRYQFWVNLHTPLFGQFWILVKRDRWFLPQKKAWTKKEINFQNAWFSAQKLAPSTGYNLR
jgi:hypothetical protein